MSPAPLFRRFPVAMSYSILVVAVALFVEISIASEPDANFAGIWLFFITLPASAFFLDSLPEDNDDHLVTLVLVAIGLAQGWLLSGVLAQIRRSRGADDRGSRSGT